MEREELLKQLKVIFSDILDYPDLELTEKTQATDVDGWDSLNHIQLVVAIEKHFKFRFTSREIQSWDNVGEMMDCILEKKRSL